MPLFKPTFKTHFQLTFVGNHLLESFFTKEIRGCPVLKLCTKLHPWTFGWCWICNSGNRFGIQQFLGRCIGGGAAVPIIWAPRSPDLNAANLYIWGHHKSLVYGDTSTISPANNGRKHSTRFEILHKCFRVRINFIKCMCLHWFRRRTFQKFTVNILIKSKTVLVINFCFV